MKQCTNCGAVNDDSSQVCQQCGAPFYQQQPVYTQGQPQPQQQRNNVPWIVGGVLAGLVIVVAGVLAALFLTRGTGDGGGTSTDTVVVEKQVESVAMPEKTTRYHSRDYVSTDSDPYAWLSGPLSYSDLSGYSKAELRILRNAIYARHGYIFKSADLRNYFSQYSWYVPRSSNVMGSLSYTEKKNVELIRSMERGY